MGPKFSHSDPSIAICGKFCASVIARLKTSRNSIDAVEG